MDSQLLSSSEKLSCSMCQDIFKNPVLRLSCSHNICKVCFDQYWKCTGSLACPVCKEQTEVASTAAQGQRNENPSEGFGSFCGLHCKKFNVFCINDGQLLCAVCHMSETHRNHECCTIDIAAHEHKEDLKTALRPLQDRRRLLKKVKSNYDQTAYCIKYQTKKTEQQIKKEFEKLHQFLQDEQASRLAALRQEEEQKSQMIEHKIDELNILISYFACIFNLLKDEIGSGKSFFQEPQMISGALIDKAKHLGNLRFRVWEKMQEIVQYTTVILDPNTAHAELSLSDDLTSVQRNHGTRNIPNNPERFDRSYCVLGSEAFTSGVHCWDVEVMDVPDWEVGVTTALIPGTAINDLNKESWSIKASHGEYLAQISAAAKFKISLEERLQRIRVRLDWDREELEFIDPITDTHLFTFSHAFTDRVFPFFITSCKLSVLRLLPSYISFTVNSGQGKDNGE
ncbi:Tripartite motif-containing protein 35 [Bagarius yarrelli]|uniref:Tripartite motif-containing protein 35 n=1 Tax=Bagarius yarrelli TaxID=175774 RepID=A0A556TM01_BAGYA|nr:Tripartite motif-containing protein 35 [Bagarius yarrelli]